jgi:hypothetical protein
MLPALDHRLIRGHRAGGGPNDPVRLGKHHPQIVFNRPAESAGNPQVGHARPGLLDEAKGESVRGFVAGSNRPQVADGIPFQIEDDVNFLVRQYGHPPGWQDNWRRVIERNLSHEPAL